MTAATVEQAPAAPKSSFSAGMRVLPKAEREAMYRIYAFCRAVDDIADDQQGDPALRQAQLDAWTRDLDDLYAGGAGGQAAYLGGSVKRFGLARTDFQAVIDGMAMDVDRDIVAPDAAELDLYCDRVASAVGRLSVKVFGMEAKAGRDLAHHLGRALQLTNILRDLDEDAEIGRLYLPREALVAAGIGTTDIAAILADPRIDGVARRIAVQAQGHYAEAKAILRASRQGHLIAPRLMAAAYAELLRRMIKAGWKAPRRRVRHNRLALFFTLLRLKLGL